MWGMGYKAIILLVLVCLAGVVDAGPEDFGRLLSGYDDGLHYDGGSNSGLLNRVLADADGWRVGDVSGVDFGLDDVGVSGLVEGAEGYRGKVFLVRGKLQQIYGVKALVHPGAWDDRLEQWGIKLAGGEGAYLLLTEPRVVAEFRRDGKGEEDAKFNVGLGVEVLAKARFLGLWEREIDGVKKRFPVFVGKSADVIYAEKGEIGKDEFGQLGLVFGVLVLMAGVVVYLRWRIGKKGVVGEKIEARGARVGEGLKEDVGLPDDAGEAMAEMARRRGEEEE